MPRDSVALLYDMLVAARDAISFIKGMSSADFFQNRQVQRAVFNAIQEVGEAANHVDPEVQESYPAIPWRDIIGMRNQLVHVYFDLDLDVVWDTLSKDLPVLISQLESLISAEPE